MLDRLRSIPLWTAVMALIFIVAKNYFHIELEGWAEVTAQVIAILTILFGIANNPADRDHF